MNEREEREVDQECAIIAGSDESVITKDHRHIRAVELSVKLLEERHTVGSNFHSINSSLSVEPVMDAVIIELVSLGCEVNAVLGESVVDLGELAPIGSLPGSRDVLVGDNSNIDLLNWVFELVEQEISVGLVDGLLLVLVDSDEREPNALNVEIVDHGVSEEVVGVKNH